MARVTRLVTLSETGVLPLIVSTIGALFVPPMSPPICTPPAPGGISVQLLESPLHVDPEVCVVLA